MANGAVAKVRFIGDAKDLLKTTKRIDSNVRGLSASFRRLGGFAKIAIGGFAVSRVVNFLKQSVRAADDAAKAQKRLDAVFTASGAKGLKLFKDLNAQAQSIAIKLGIDDDEVAAVQLKLSAYLEAFAFQGAEGAKRFKEATQLAFDIDAAGLADAETAAKTIGRVLLEPLDAANRLKKLGIQLTNDEIGAIKELVAQGKIAEAQAIILDAISRQVGGTAEANATALDKMKAAIGRIVEAIGTLLLPLLEPTAMALQFVAQKVEDWTGANSDFATKMQTAVIPTIKDTLQKFADWVRDSGLASGATNLFRSVLEALGLQTDTTKGKIQDLSKETNNYKLANEEATKAVTEAAKRKQTLKDTVDNLKNSFRNLISALGDLLASLGVPLLTILAKLAEKQIPSVIGQINLLTTIFEGLTSGVKNLVEILTNLAKLFVAIASGNASAIKKALQEIVDDARKNVQEMEAFYNRAKAIAASMTGSNTVPKSGMPFGGNDVFGNPITPTVPKVTTPTFSAPNIGGKSSSSNKGSTIVKEVSTQTATQGVFNISNWRQGEERSMELLEATRTQNEKLDNVVDELSKMRAMRNAEKATYNVEVNTLQPTAQVGRAVVEAIKQFEQRSGSADRFSALAL